MKKTIGFYEFCDSFSEERKDTFSYNGKKALFEYLEQYEEETGTDIELDIVALCCEYTEYESATEAASNYFEFEGMEYGEEGEELETMEEVEEKALKFLQDSTQVIEFEGGIIIQDF